MIKVNNKRFISFEGIDFSGKTTQIDLLQKFLEEQNFKVFVLREPGGTSISEKIRKVLLDVKNAQMSSRCEMLLYSAARTQLVYEKIIPLLNEGYYIIADRYVDSTTAYQGYGRGLDPETVSIINETATFGLLPVKTFFLDIKPETAEQRRLNNSLDADRLESAGREFFKRVYDGYHEIAAKAPDRFEVIDAENTVEEIQRRIKKIIVSKTMDG